MPERRDVTDSISVAWHGTTVHLNISLHFPDGEFLTSALLLSPAQARDLASALTEMAEVGEVANSPEAVPA